MTDAMTDVVEADDGDFVWGFSDGPAAVVEAVRLASAEADGNDPLDEAILLRLRHRGLSGARLWTAGEDGFALLHDDNLDLAVHPRARGRGLGSALLAAALPGADQAAPLDAWSHGNHPAAARLARRFGFRPVRDLWVMRRDAEGELPEAPAVPGVRIRTFRAGDGIELLRVNAAAFADHPEQGRLDIGGLTERMAESWFDPAGLLVAEDAGDRMLGFHWTKQHSAEVGEVYVVGVSPQAQGRGLGRLLTVAGLRHLAGLGVREVLLYVESDNAPAIRMYERFGFTHEETDTHVMYRR